MGSNKAFSILDTPTYQRISVVTLSHLSLPSIPLLAALVGFHWFSLNDEILPFVGDFIIRCVSACNVVSCGGVFSRGDSVGLV